MKVTEGKPAHAELTRYFDFGDDAPAIAWPYSRNGKRVLVDRVAITYTWDPHNREWQHPRHFEVKIFGAALKKDGTPGLVRYAERPAYEWRNMFNEEYEWLRQLVAAGIPEHRLPALPEVVEVNADRES